MATLNGENGQADLPPVSNDERGQQIRRRRMGLGIRSVRELAIRSGVSRGAVSAAEHGEGSRGVYERLEHWLSEQEASGETLPPVEPMQLEQIEFTVEGDFGVKVTVKGPIADRAALEDSVSKIIRSIRQGDPED